MDGTPTQDHRGLRVERRFEANRLAGQFLAEVYEQVVPIHRVGISTGGEVAIQDGGDEETRGRAGGDRLEAGGYR